MTKRFFVIVSIILSTVCAKSESFKNVTISLLTASPGTELYSVFGHTAIRVQDPLHEIDVVYNYGVFDFNTPNFGLKFLKGNLDYMLAKNSFPAFYQSYFWEQRALEEQTLNLTDSQKQKIVELLETNYLPENRYYRYKFLNDNCATRVRDIIAAAVGDSALFDRAKTSFPKLTYRQMMSQFLGDFPWVDFGINLALGMPSDKQTNNSEKMFLPDYMKVVAAKSHYKNGEPVVTEARTLLANIKDPISTANFLTPISVFFALLTISLIGFSSRKFSKIYGSIFFFLVGLFGLILSAIILITDHEAIKQNLNLLWALPTHILLFRSVARSHISKFERYYFFITAGISAILIITWGHFPQQFHPAIIPILLTIIVISLQVSIQRYKPINPEVEKVASKKRKKNS